MINNFKTILIVFLTIIVSCTTHKLNNNTLQNILSELNKSKYYNNKDVSRIKIEKRVSYIHENITLELASDKISYPQEEQSFLTIIRDDFGKYTLPILSNSYRNYWEFENEDSNNFAPNLSTTFEKELKNSFHHLRLSDTNNLDWFLLQKIFVDGMNCREIEIQDTNFLASTSSTNCIKLLGEDDYYWFNSLVDRNKRTIVENFNKRSSCFFFDDKYYRIYEVIYNNINWRRDSCNFGIRTYRFEALRYPLNI